MLVVEQLVIVDAVLVNRTVIIDVTVVRSKLMAVVHEAAVGAKLIVVDKSKAGRVIISRRPIIRYRAESASHPGGSNADAGVTETAGKKSGSEKHKC